MPFLSSTLPRSHSDGCFFFLLDKVGHLLFCLAGHRHVSSGPGQAGRVASFAASLWHSCLYIKVTLAEVLHSARQVLQATWSIKHLNDNHSYTQTLSPSRLCVKFEMINAWACTYKYSFPLSLQPCEKELVPSECLRGDFDGAWTLGQINLLRDLKVHASQRQSFKRLLNSLNPLTLHCFKTQHLRPRALYPHPAQRCKSERTAAITYTSADPSYPCTWQSRCVVFRRHVLYVFRGVKMQS